MSQCPKLEEVVFYITHVALQCLLLQGIDSVVCRDSLGRLHGKEQLREPVEDERAELNGGACLSFSLSSESYDLFLSALIDELAKDRCGSLKATETLDAIYPADVLVLLPFFIYIASYGVDKKAGEEGGGDKVGQKRVFGDLEVGSKKSEQWREWMASDPFLQGLTRAFWSQGEKIARFSGPEGSLQPFSSSLFLIHLHLVDVSFCLSGLQGGMHLHADVGEKDHQIRKLAVALQMSKARNFVICEITGAGWSDRSRSFASSSSMGGEARNGMHAA